MNAKETITDFNQIFTTFLNKLPTPSSLVVEILCGFYLSALPTTIVVFMMSKDLPLEGKFDVAEKF